MNPLNRPGTYALVLAAPSPTQIVVGALGEVSIDKGYLVYVGSAFGPGGLAGRLKHHSLPIHRTRWHIDYLRRECALLGAWCASGSRSLEHGWADELAGAGGFSAPRRGLGSSDCKCPTHLFHSSRRPIGRWIRERLVSASGTTQVKFYRADQLTKTVTG